MYTYIHMHVCTCMLAGGYCNVHVHSSSDVCITLRLDDFSVFMYTCRHTGS